MQPSRDISRLLEIMAALRDPVGGCPWDLEQDFSTVAPYTIEEAYEVADAIERQDPEDLREELGDLLLQVVFHAELARQAGLFQFGDVVEAITRKMIRRHPHVFGDRKAWDAGSAKSQWERIKAEERAEKAALRRRRLDAGAEATGQTAEASRSLLDTVPPGLPALTLALKIQQSAAKVGFDWDAPEPIMAKIREEIDEFEEAMTASDEDAAEAEFGDLLFSLVNLARHRRIDPEKALRRCVRKFRDRFGHIEASLARSGRSLDEAGLDEMEALWVEAKRLQSAGGLAK